MSSLPYPTWRSGVPRPRTPRLVRSGDQRAEAGVELVHRPNMTRKTIVRIFSSRTTYNTSLHISTYTAYVQGLLMHIHLPPSSTSRFLSAHHIYVVSAIYHIFTGMPLSSSFYILVYLMGWVGSANTCTLYTRTVDWLGLLATLFFLL